MGAVSKKTQPKLYKEFLVSRMFITVILVGSLGTLD